LEATYEKLQIYKSKIQEALLLGKELMKEKSKRSKQIELNVDMSKMIQSQEDEPKCLKSKVAKAKTTLRILQINEAHFKDLITGALNENSHLQEHCKQIL
jgi:ribosomal protein L16 Arg81 hydroxylase